MSLLKTEHVIIEIEGESFRVVESGCDKSRADFLQKLLEHNNVTIKIQEKSPVKEGEVLTYTVATPDKAFNPIVKVYNRELKTFDGHHVTPDYWNQKTTEADPNYWDLSKKDWLKKKAGE